MAGADTSTLEIKVITKGINGNDGVVKQLGKLEDQAKKTEDKVVSLTQKVQFLINTQGSAATAANKYSNALSEVQKALNQIGVQAGQINSALGQVTNGMNAKTNATERATRAVRDHDYQSRVAITTIKAMATAFAMYTTVKVAKSIVEAGDAWALLTARLTVATGSINNAKVAQQQIFEVSQRLRVPLEETARLYTRISPPMQRMGKQGEDVIKVVEGVGLALKLSGASGAEASSAMLQLSQSFNAGRLNGAEFSAVAEAAPKLLDAMAAHMGVTRGELKKLGSDGKITGEVMAEAIAKAAPMWEEQFSKLPITVDDAMTRVKNSWVKSMGEMSGDTGLNKGLAASIIQLEKLIPVVRDNLAGAFIAVMNWITKNREGLGQVWDQVKGVVGGVWDAVGALMKMFAGVNDTTNGVEVLAAGLFGVRVLIAAAVDMARLLGASFVHVGSDIVDVLLWPLRIAVKAFGTLAETARGFWELVAKGARAIGKDDIAYSIEKAVGGLNRMANSASTLDNDIANVTAGARNLANSWLEGWKSGNTEVDKLLNGQTQVTKELEKQEKLKYDNSVNQKGGKAPEDEKAAKAAAKATEKHNKEMDSLNDALREQAELYQRLSEFGLDYEKLGKGAKERIEIQRQLNAGAKGLVKTRLEERLAIALQVEAMEALNEVTKEGLKAEEQHNKTMETRIKAAEDEAVAMERKAATYGMAKGAVEAMELASLKAELTATRQLAGMEKEVAMLERLIAAKERNAKAAGELGILETKTELDKLFDPSKGEKFGKAVEGAFGKAGKAMGLAVKALENYDKRQSALDKKRVAINKLPEAERLEYIKKFQEEEAEGQLRTYSEMTAAGKHFFKEGSKGYQAMETAEKVFRAAELAMALNSFVQKTFFSQAESQAAIQGEQQKLAAKEISTAETIRLATMEAQANAGVAVTNQGGGDPYSAFVRIAAMAAIMAGLGFAVGGGSAKAFNLEERQSKTGTGTVFGDASAKSASISNSIEFLADNSDIALKYSSQMAASLRNIEASMIGLSNIIIRTTGLTTGKNMGIFEGTLSTNKGDPIANMLGINQNIGLFGLVKNLPIIGGIVGKLQSLWGKTTQKIQDSGLSIGGTISDLDMRQYADVETKKSSWFGLSKKSSFSTQYGEVGPELQNQFSLLFVSISNSITSAIGSLGGNQAAISQALSQFFIDTTKLSLKDLSGEEVEEALNAFVSSIADRMAMSANAGFVEFQRIGEGYYETLVRVASGIETSKYALDQLGISVVDYNTLSNKQGDVATEIIRESLMMAERTGPEITKNWLFFSQTVKSLSGVGEILRDFTGSAEELVEVYKQLTNIRDNMRLTGLGDNLTRDVIYGAGGAGNLESALEDFISGMFSESEQLAIKTSKLNESFAKLGISVPKSNKEYRELVSRLMQGDAASQQLAGKVLLLTEAFIDVSEATDAVTESLRDNLDEARNVLIDTYEREASALEETKNRFEAFAKSLREFRTSLILGDKSPLTNAQKYSESRAEFERIAALATSGDEDAISRFQSMATEFLDISRVMNASGSAYTQDFNRVLELTQMLETYADEQVDVASESLRALKDQVSQLVDLNETTVSVHQAIIDVGIAITAMGDKLTVAQSSTVLDAMYQSMLGRGADAAGKSYWTGRLNDGMTVGQVQQGFLNSPEYRVKQLYSEILGRTADQEGLAYWMEEATRVSQTQLATNFVNSVMAAGTQSEMERAMAYARQNGIPGFDKGINSVPYDMLAMVHEDERIMPAADNRELMARLSSPNESNAVLVAEVKALREEIKQLKESGIANTDRSIAANYDANERASNNTVKGTVEAFSATKWEKQSKVGLE